MKKLKKYFVIQLAEASCDNLIIFKEGYNAFKAFGLSVGFNLSKKDYGVYLEIVVLKRDEKKRQKIISKGWN